MSSSKISWSFPVKTQAGIFCLNGTKHGLYQVLFPGKRKGSTRFTPTRCDKSHLVRVKWLSQYFRNPNIPIEPKMDLSGCTAFEMKVYRALCRVPPGKVISYSHLAKRAGFPGAARAVGTAMRKNRLPIMIPCHRVIRGDGSLGQYSRGLRWKRFLLKHEGFLE